MGRGGGGGDFEVKVSPAVQSTVYMHRIHLSPGVKGQHRLDLRHLDICNILTIILAQCTSKLLVLRFQITSFSHQLGPSTSRNAHVNFAQYLFSNRMYRKGRARAMAARRVKTTESAVLGSSLAETASFLYQKLTKAQN